MRNRPTYPYSPREDQDAERGAHRSAPEDRPSHDDRIGEEERLELERRMSGEEEDVFPDREVDPETGLPVSRSKGIGYGSMLPFFIGLLVLVVGAFYVAMSIWELPAYDTSNLGTPDMTVEEVIAELFQEAPKVSGYDLLHLFVDDVEILQMKMNKVHPFAAPLGERYEKTLQLLQTGDFTRKTASPVEPAGEEYTATITYERRDLNTNQQTEETLWVARTPEGWRIVGFD